MSDAYFSSHVQEGAREIASQEKKEKGTVSREVGVVGDESRTEIIYAYVFIYAPESICDSKHSGPPQPQKTPESRIFS